MDNKKTTYVTIALSILLFLVFLIAQQALHRENSIVLPEYVTESGTGEDSTGTKFYNILSISPKTVQAAISTLARPAAFERTQTIETFWDGGSSTSIFSVAVSSGMTRIDTTLVDNSTCHILMNADTAAVWYDDETTWATLKAGQLSADSLQRMPTYESVLAIKQSSIAQAEYCEKDGIWCIFVQTRQNMSGYTERYWVSIQSGLLYCAERLFNGNLIYRFTAAEPKNAAPDDSRFLLPDGSALQ